MTVHQRGKGIDVTNRSVYRNARMVENAWDQVPVTVGQAGKECCVRSLSVSRNVCLEVNASGRMCVPAGEDT